MLIYLKNLKCYSKMNNIAYFMSIVNYSDIK